MDCEDVDKPARKYSPDPYHDLEFSGEVEPYGDSTSSESHYYEREDALDKQKEEFKVLLTYMENQMDTMLRTFNPYSRRINPPPRVTYPLDFLDLYATRRRNTTPPRHTNSMLTLLAMTKMIARNLKIASRVW